MNAPETFIFNLVRTKVDGDYNEGSKSVLFLSYLKTNIKKYVLNVRSPSPYPLGRDLEVYYFYIISKTTMLMHYLLECERCKIRMINSFL